MVRLNGKYCIINKIGNIIIPSNYSFAEGWFAEGIIQTKFNGKYGFIDKKGVEYWED
jgi:hypothetical protein